MSVDVVLPELGESVVEGTVARWLVKEGDRVEIDQPLVEVTTDKVDAEIPAPESGVVVAILAAEGETIAVGAAIARIDAAAAADAGAPAPAPAPPATGAAPAASAAPRATPAAKHAAADAGVDLGSVAGSGVSGRIMKEDVTSAAQAVGAVAGSPAAAAAASPVPPEPTPAPAPRASARASGGFDEDRARQQFGRYTLQEGDRVEPMSPLRRIVADHMVYSKRTAPHVGTVTEIDMGGIVEVRARHKQSFRQDHGFGLTYLPFIVDATVRALREFPVLNSSVVDDAIVIKRDIHMGIAVETEKGLVVPVVRHADRLSLAGLAAAVEDLSARARNKKLSADDLKGGTFTISNPGRQGNLYGFAIINQPQVGILRMGEMVKRPVVRELEGSDAIVIRPMMHLALSYDHRAVDGAPANGFLYRIRELLEEAEFDL